MKLSQIISRGSNVSSILFIYYCITCCHTDVELHNHYKPERSFLKKAHRFLFIYLAHYLLVSLVCVHRMEIIRPSNVFYRHIGR